MRFVESVVVVARTFDPAIISAATAQVAHDLKGLPPEIWLQDHGNVALCNEEGDVALFEKRGEKIYCGHYFYMNRGHRAIEVSKNFLSEIFSGYASIIIGLTPLDKKGALWMTRHLGFTFIEDVDIDGRPHRVSVLTKKDYDEQSTRRQ